MASIPGYTPQRQINFEVFKAAWKLFEKNPAVWLVTMLVVMVAVGIPVLVLSLFIPFIGGFLGSIPGMIILVGMFRMAFKQIRGVEVSVGDAFDVQDVLAPAAVAAAVFYLVQSIIVTAGILFCGVGIFVAGPIVVLAQALLYRAYFPEKSAA